MPLLLSFGLSCWFEFKFKHLADVGETSEANATLTAQKPLQVAVIHLESAANFSVALFGRSIMQPLQLIFELLNYSKLVHVNWCPVDIR